jgi:hypothetical protein
MDTVFSVEWAAQHLEFLRDTIRPGNQVGRLICSHGYGAGKEVSK